MLLGGFLSASTSNLIGSQCCCISILQGGVTRIPHVKQRASTLEIERNDEGWIGSSDFNSENISTTACRSSALHAHSASLQRNVDPHFRELVGLNDVDRCAITRRREFRRSSFTRRWIMPDLFSPREGKCCLPDPRTRVTGSRFRLLTREIWRERERKRDEDIRRHLPPVALPFRYLVISLLPLYPLFLSIVANLAPCPTSPAIHGHRSSLSRKTFRDYESCSPAGPISPCGIRPPSAGERPSSSYHRRTRVSFVTAR